MYTATEVRYPVEFSATAGEYFRIWIVNLALNIVTLGIYSAWAKVRKRRYFYACTRIDGEGFEYRAKPLAILKGRLIAAALLAVFIAVGQFAPDYQWTVWVSAAAFGPWLLVRSFAFNASNTAYRNVRLRFQGTYGQCMKILLTHAWVVLIPILYPYLKRKLVEFVARNHSYGTTRFEVGDFRKAFAHAYGNGVGLGLLWIIACVAVGLALGGKPASGKNFDSEFTGVAMLVGAYGSFLVAFPYIRARTLNAVWNNIRIGSVRFESTLGAGALIGIYVSNLLAIVCTLGLATPWAVVRTHRYRARHSAVISAGPIGSFAQAEAQQVGVVGQEIGEMLDFDITL